MTTTPAAMGTALCSGERTVELQKGASDVTEGSGYRIERQGQIGTLGDRTTLRECGEPSLGCVLSPHGQREENWERSWLEVSEVQFEML